MVKITKSLQVSDRKCTQGTYKVHIYLHVCTRAVMISDIHNTTDVAKQIKDDITYKNFKMKNAGNHMYL